MKSISGKENKICKGSKKDRGHFKHGRKARGATKAGRGVAQDEVERQVSDLKNKCLQFQFYKVRISLPHLFSITNHFSTWMKK